MNTVASPRATLPYFTALWRQRIMSWTPLSFSALTPPSQHKARPAASPGRVSREGLRAPLAAGSAPVDSQRLGAHAQRTRHRRGEALAAIGLEHLRQ